MTSWIITHKPSFLSDLVNLSRNLQKAVARGLEELEQDPITPRGDTIKKLAGYPNLYRYRLGDFRLIYAAAEKARMINLLAIGSRGAIYERFNYEGWDAPGAAIEFGSEMVATPAFVPPKEWFLPKESDSAEHDEQIALTVDQLDRWLIPQEYHNTLRQCRNEDDLMNCNVPYEVLSRVVDSIDPPTVDKLAAQPDLMLFDPEDLLRYADGTLTSFLLKLDEQQEPLTSWALAGPTLVKGGPGSGKSTVALYRVRSVVRHFMEQNGRVPEVLFTTYTNALINFSESLLGQLLHDTAHGKKGELPKQIRVSTVHKTATYIAHASGQAFTIADENKQLEALHAARAAVQPREVGDAAKIPIANAIQPLRDKYLLQEFDWVIEGQNCRTEADYLAADRTGRGISFSTARRQAVWKVYELFRDSLLAQELYTFGHLTQVALEQVRSGAFTRRWDYVIVDEAQDLPPTALALAVELCSAPSGVFLMADANQSLYNRGFRWRNVHDSLKLSGRTRVLRRNYRSTRQIAAASAEIMTAVPGMDDESMHQDYAHVGPQPVIYAAQGETDQWRWIANRIYEAARELRLPVNAAAVLVNSSTIGNPLAAALSDYGLPAKFMSSSQFDLNEPCIKVTTLHAAKGLEFPIVVVAHVEAGRIPRETEATDSEELASFEEAQRRLLFVGCTRAMRRLFITYNRELPSPFLAGLSADRWGQVESVVGA